MRAGWLVVASLAAGMIVGPWNESASAECDRVGGASCFTGDPRYNATAECADQIETGEFTAAVDCSVAVWTDGGALLVAADVAQGKSRVARVDVDGNVTATFRRAPGHPVTSGFNYTFKLHPRVPGIDWTTSTLNFSGYVPPHDTNPRMARATFHVHARPTTTDVNIEYVTWDTNHDFHRRGVGFTIAQARTPSLDPWLLFLVAVAVVVVSFLVERRR